MEKIKLYTVNGYSILLISIPSKATYVQGYIQTGFINENKTNIGLSHLVEHISVSSWKKCKTSCPKFWKNKGVIQNAYTGNTFVGYWIEGLSKYTENMIEYIISQSTCDWPLKKRIFKGEKKAVKEEILRNFNTQQWKLWDQLMKSVYYNCGTQFCQDWPLQLENLKKFNESDVINFCNKLYIPSKTLFTVAGSFDNKKIIQLFGTKLKKKFACPTPKKFNINNEKIVKFIENKKHKKTDIIIAFHSTFYPCDKETQLFGIIEILLSGGLESILLNHLREKLHLIYSLSLSFDTDITGTITTIEVNTSDENVKKVIEQIFLKLKEFNEKKYDRQLLNGAKNKFLIQKAETCKTVQWLSDWYGSQYANQLDKKEKKIYTFEKIINIIEKTTKKELATISKKLFNLKKFKIIYMGKSKLHKRLKT